MNLNTGLRRRTFQKNSITLLFAPKKILKELVSRIKMCDYVVGCVAWFTNKVVLKALERKRGCSFVVTRHKMARVFKATYDALPKMDKKSPVRVVGNGRGMSKNLMHHKFVVGLDSKRKPLFVATGSFNITKSAESNLENMIIVDDPDIAQQYFLEFQRVRRMSKSI